MKGVILAGGNGTRMRPFSLNHNKALAPIYTKNQAIPQIFFPLRTLVDSGIKDILIISSREHCGSIIETLGDGVEYGCNLTYRIQDMNQEITGIAQALKLAQNFVGSSKFAVILGDNYFSDNFYDQLTSFRDDTSKDCNLFFKWVFKPERFGVIDRNNRIVEKPKEFVSNYAVCGLYLYNSRVFDILHQLKPSERKEIEITDVNNWMIDNASTKFSKIEGKWSDMGTPESAMEVSRMISDLK